MKRIMRYTHQVICVLAFVLVLSNFIYASPAINEISEADALKLATVYYAMNTQEKKIEFDQYAVTALYDIDGNITYYAVDFFYKNDAKGYIIIGGNLNYIQCVEFSFNSSSKYFLNANNNTSTIYYTPFNTYTYNKESATYHDHVGKPTKRHRINGEVIKGSLYKNRSFTRAVTSFFASGNDVFNINTQNFNMEDIIYFKGVFTCHPKEYLTRFGYDFNYTSGFGSIENQMVAAGAFHPMYNHGSAPSNYYSLTNVSNPNHCAITAMSNILRYWKSICCPNYPESYNSLFGTVAVQAESLDYFDRTPAEETISYFNGNALEVMIATNLAYGYSGRGFSCYEADWDFLKTYIDNDWPIYMSIHDRVVFTQQTVMSYDDHAVVAFAYNVLHATHTETGEATSLSFVKVFDGWGDYQPSPQSLSEIEETDYPYNGGGVRYISWDMLEYYILPLEGEPIDVTMHAFCPYQI